MLPLPADSASSARRSSSARPCHPLPTDPTRSTLVPGSRRGPSRPAHHGWTMPRSRASGWSTSFVPERSVLCSKVSGESTTSSSSTYLPFTVVTIRDPQAEPLMPRSSPTILPSHVPWTSRARSTRSGRPESTSSGSCRFGTALALTSVHYPAAHGFVIDAGNNDLPVTEAYAARSVTLPLFPHLTDAQQDSPIPAGASSTSRRRLHRSTAGG